MNIQTIKKRIAHIEGCREEIKKIKEIIDGQLEGNTEYQEAHKKSKEATSAKKRIKEEVLAKPENEKLSFEVKENQEEIKTEEQILATELVEYYQKNNSDEIEDDAGQKRKFKISVKLFPARNSE